MEHPADRPAPLPRWLLPVAVVVAIVATLATTTVALGASTRLAAACDGVSLRTKPSTSSAVVVRISAGVRVTAVDRVRGGRWTTRCKGSLVAGHGWYRITVVRQKTVREKYGRRYLYAAVGLFRKVPIAGTTAPAPTPTPTPSPTPSPTEAAIAPTPTPSLAPPPEASATSTPSGTPAAPTPTPTPTATATPTATPTPTPTSTPAPTPTPPASGVVTLPSSVTFYGRGWGHGVGLSQYGAYGRAKAGESAKTILAHYYAKTSIGTIANPQVRVLVLDDYGATATNPATFYGRNGPWTIDGIDGTFPADARLRLMPSVSAGGTSWKAIVDAADGSRLYAGATEGNLRLRPASDATTLQVFSKPSARDTYRGVLHIVAGTTVDVVNILPMESYLRGVVPAEVPSSWPRAALRAQAIAARSYAAYRLHPGSGRYDLHDDTRSQVYIGVLGERAATDAAVADTAGEVVTSAGAVANTLFHSSDGGWTENNENVFVSSTGAKVAGAVSYLRGSSDRAPDGSSFDAGSPYATWRTGTYDRATIQSIFAADSRTDVGSVVALDLSNRGVSGRLVSVTLIGSTGTRKTVSGEVFIGVFNAHRPTGDPIIRSTLFALAAIP